MTKHPRRPDGARALRPAPRPSGRRAAAVRSRALTGPAALAALAAVSLTACSGLLRFAPATQPPGRPPVRTSAALHRLVADGAPGAAALVTRPRSAAAFTTAGVADLRSGRTIRRGDHFRAGSLTKTLVATVVLQLAAEHRLTLHDSAARHLPRGVPATGDGGRSDLRRVTIRQLLEHTTGLFNYTDDPRLAYQLFGNGFGAHRYDHHTPAELLRTALGHPPVAAPGTRYSYSNTNYLVLGLVIEAVTGHPYATEIRRRLLVPARLGHTSFPGTDPVLPDPHGRAYTRVGDRRVDATSLDPSRAGPAGEMVTTLGDLNRFFSALLGGRFLAPRQMAELRDARPTGGHGLGLHTTELPCGVTVWGHSGHINGSYVRTAATAGGRHVLSYRVNTDAVPAPAPDKAVLTAEFCAPHQDGPRPPRRTDTGPARHTGDS
ncbi:serine hydrolase domain-containing protein [Streptomyces sp. NPDC058773]|uniref:serine hydrolase domain-containing protein n=1 Tax=Streptomyces sp. NPDC058773 TaxID=3346632 RepID=UPI0036D1FDB0